MKKVLVVEDTAVLREEIVDILNMEGYQTIEAENGLEGLNMVKTGKPDIIVSDILMPKLNGFQMLKELQKDSLIDNIPFIFLSAKSDRIDIREGMNLGAEDYLVKPLSPNELIVTIKNKLNKQDRINQKCCELRKNISQSIPHELRTPLNGILGLSSLLKDPKDYNYDEITKMASYIYESGERLHNLIENFILYSSLTVQESNSEKKDLQQSPIYTKDIIESKIKEIGEKEDRLSNITIDLTEFKLKINKKDLSKIIEELVSNAIKFSVPGDRIKVSSRIIMQNFIISVRNEGIGISQENITKINGFMQFDRQQREQQGIGLGLSIVKLLTSLYNGDFKIDSNPGEYFKIELSFRK